MRKACQPSEEKLEEGRGGANQTAGRQKIFKRGTKRVQRKPPQIQAQGLGVQGSLCGGSEEENYISQRQASTGQRGGTTESSMSGLREQASEWTAGPGQLAEG